MSDATSPRLKVSREGLVLIKSFEGFRPRAVRDQDGRWVIGYGHTASAREGSTVSERDAELLLQYDLLSVVKALNEQAPTPLNQHQFDALASFAISIGVDRFLESDVLQRVKEGHAGEAADALIGWPAPMAPDAPLRRRAAERALFMATPGAPTHLADLLTAPLPAPPAETPGGDSDEMAKPNAAAKVDARAAAVAALLGEPTPSTAPEPGEPTADPAPETGGPFQPGPFDTPATAAIHLQRYSPYATAIIGPLAGFPTVEDAARGAGAEDAAKAKSGLLGAAEVEPAESSSAPTGTSPFAGVESPLALTPATEADFEQPAPAGHPSVPDADADASAAESPAPVEDSAPLEEEPTVAVLRREIEPAAPRRFDWSVTGAFAIMGLTGLAACGGSAAAFRKAMVDESQFSDFAVIGGVLAVIGVICVSVSAWNLFVQWGRRD